MVEKYGTREKIGKHCLCEGSGADITVESGDSESVGGFDGKELEAMEEG